MFWICFVLCCFFFISYWFDLKYLGLIQFISFCLVVSFFFNYCWFFLLPLFYVFFSYWFDSKYLGLTQFISFCLVVSFFLIIVDFFYCLCFMLISFNLSWLALFYLDLIQIIFIGLVLSWFDSNYLDSSSLFCFCFCFIADFRLNHVHFLANPTYTHKHFNQGLFNKFAD